MIRTFVFALLGLMLMAAPSAADEPPIVVRDPGQYAQTFADSMALAGVRPLRDAFTTLIAPAALPPEGESSLRIYETSITQLPARVSRVIEDVVLGDALRTIYLYHYYNDNAWIFTRLDFVRIGEDQWALTRLAFSDRWANVVLTTTPGFRPPTPPRR